MFELTLVTPTNKILEKTPLKSVKVPAFKGEVEIHEKHSTLVTTLTAGALTYELQDGTTDSVAISWGYCEVFDDTVTVLAETAESAKDIDLERAEIAKTGALEKMGQADFEDMEKYRRKFHRAETRLKVAKQ